MNDIISYSFGNKVRCPKCNAPRVKFQLRSSAMIEQLREGMQKKYLRLETIWNIIKNHFNSIPWLCKNCFQSGVVLFENHRNK